MAGDARLPRFAAAFVSACEREFQLVAGAEGLEALALQFPAQAETLVTK